LPRPVLIARDLEAIAPGGEISVAADTLITPLAREEAERRGITIRLADRAAAAASRVVALGADHGGYALKEQVKDWLSQWGYRVMDLGTGSAEPVDYPDFAEAVALAVARGEACCGIVVDTVGVGSAMAANKVPGVRAAPCYDTAAARSSREHNDANLLALGARALRPEEAREIVALWLETPFAGGRHERRVGKIRALDERYRKG
jgi:ribose 5-phosphate isomerase B